MSWEIVECLNDGYLMRDYCRYTEYPFFVTTEEFESNFFECERCGEVFKWEDMHEGCSDAEVNLCEECGEDTLFWCGYHEQWEYGRDYAIYISDADEYWCEYAGDSESNYCHHCGDRFAYEDSGSNDRYDEWYCNDCRDRGYGSFRNSDLIWDYHEHDADEKAEFLDNEYPSKKLHMGFELEVHYDGCGDSEYAEMDGAELVDEVLEDRVVMEYDCSIAPGFEIISRPATLDYWMDNFEQISDTCRGLVSQRFVSHNGGKCGFHIHLDRNYFGLTRIANELAEAKFLWIFDNHWENLCKFSRRRSFHWCNKVNTSDAISVYNYSKCTCENKPATVCNIVKSGRDRACGHGVAVNISNDNTIEIRLWRGSLKPSTLKATLKFTARLAEIVKTTSVINLTKMSFEDLLGDDPDILAYWETVKDRTITQE